MSLETEEDLDKLKERTGSSREDAGNADSNKSKDADGNDGDNCNPSRQFLIGTIVVLAIIVLALVIALIVVAVGNSSDTSDSTDDDATTYETYFWTKYGLELIPLSMWSYFSTTDEANRPYVADLPFPGDEFTSDHLSAWNAQITSNITYSNLLTTNIISVTSNTSSVSSVPTLFSDPIWMDETAIDYRIQFAADIGSTLLGASALKGRLRNPSGRRLREHFYRFPDQCDATPIALEVFLRLMIYDQIEAFFTDESIGLWHDLFPEVQRRTYDVVELSIARWYGERYAESYVHQTTTGWVYPLRRQNIDTQMLAVGLDPNDTTTDTSTAAGLGNVIGERVTTWMQDNDKLARENDFVDEVGLARIEERHPVSDRAWHQWVPTYAGSSRFQGLRFGIVTQQTFVTPSLGMFSFLYDNETDFAALDLLDAVPTLNTSEEAYIARAQEFLMIQDELTDEHKALAELANNKISGSVFLILAYVPLLKQLASEQEYDALYDEFSMVTSGCAEYAATHAAWRHKRTYLAGRPQSVMKGLAERSSTFRAMYPEAEQFVPMIVAGDHPEYPSGSCAIYTAFAVAADDWFEKRFNYVNASQRTGTLTFTVPADKFYWNDGPVNDVELSFSSLDEWIQLLPVSRVYAGVHWLESGDAGLQLGKAVGHACSRLLDRLRAGDMSATYTASSRQNISAFNV